MGDVAATRDRVQRMLADLFGRIEVDRDGDFTFRHGSTRVFISVGEAFGEHTVVNVRAITNLRVPASPELFHYVATDNHYTLGALRAHEGDEGVLISFRQTILGDTLDPDELQTAVLAVAFTADDVDDQIQQRFGGARFHEDE
jgi:hypothetical protein